MNVTCTVTITEIDGKLAIFAKIPDGAEKTIAGQLAERLVEGASLIMNEVLGVDQSVQRVSEQ